MNAGLLFLPFLVVLFGLARLRRAASNPLEGVREVDCMLHEACKVGLEVNVGEANVVLKTPAQSGGLDDRENLLDSDLGRLFSDSLEAVGPQERLVLYKEELHYALRRLDSHVHLEEGLDHFGQFVLRDDGC